jgi:moderate conductance mechanosensitive channel
VTAWALHHGTRIGGVLVVTALALWLSQRLVPRAIRLTMRPVDEPPADETDRPPHPAEQEKRADTIAAVLVRAIDVVVIVLAALLVLGEIGFSVTPLLAGAGVAGIAIGFGAQSLVRDLLSGFFIVLENQYTRGDIVNVAGLGGVVEEMNLRRTLLRDLNGALHSVPNGEIRIASNLTRGWSRVNLDVSVAYESDLAHARSVIDRVGRELAEDPDWSPLILEPPKTLRVEELGDSGITIKVLGTTRPMKQWEVSGELRERLKRTFEAEGIEIPYPHQVVVVRTESEGDSDGGPGRSDPGDRV